MSKWLCTICAVHACFQVQSLASAGTTGKGPFWKSWIGIASQSRLIMRIHTFIVNIQDSSSLLLWKIPTFHSIIPLFTCWQSADIILCVIQSSNYLCSHRWANKGTGPNWKWVSLPLVSLGLIFSALSRWDATRSPWVFTEGFCRQFLLWVTFSANPPAR